MRKIRIHLLFCNDYLSVSDFIADVRNNLLNYHFVLFIV